MNIEPTQTTVPVIAITGNTYPARKALKQSVGGPKNIHFEKEPEPTWFVPLALAEQIAPVVARFNLDTEETTLDFDPFRELTREELRERRAEIRNRNADQLEARAASRRTKAGNLDTDVKRGSNGNDYNFWTQPAMHHNSRVRAFENHRERLRETMCKAGDLREEARELERRAEALRHTPAIKGDAERAREAAREELNKVITVGSPIINPSWALSKGYVIKVNRKTYTVEWETGDTFAIEKTFVKLDTSRPKQEARAGFAFKNGDIVAITNYLGSRRIGQITRVNRNTVSYRHFLRSINDWGNEKAARGDVSTPSEEERAAFKKTLEERNPDAPVIWLEKFREVCGTGRALTFKGTRLDAFSISTVVQLCVDSL